MRKSKYQIHEENREKINEILEEVKKYYKTESFVKIVENIIDITIENLKEKDESK